MLLPRKNTFDEKETFSRISSFFTVEESLFNMKKRSKEINQGQKRRALPTSQKEHYDVVKTRSSSRTQDDKSDQYQLRCIRFMF